MKKRQVLNNIIYFFPFQLLITYFKRNQFLIFLWLIIFGFLTSSLGNKFGIPTLFLEPEYLDRVGFAAYFIYGLSFGAFVIAFNISSYIVNGYRFPFIVTLEHPFFKFSINNFIIPLSAIIMFIINSVEAQHTEELLSNSQILLNISGFVLGVLGFVIFTFSYFFRTNKDVEKYFGIKKEKLKTKKIVKPLTNILDKDKQWKQQMSPHNNKYGQWRVETYLTPKLKIKKSRDFSHYPQELIVKTLNQNHYNSVLYGIFIFLIILTLIFFNDLHYFNFPASVSFLLFFNFLILMYSLSHLLFKEWSFVVISSLLVVLLMYPKEDFLNYNNSAYGLKYYNKIIELKRYKRDLEQNLTGDKNSTIEILNAWKSKNIQKQGELPKIIFVNTSGGGLKAGLWTYKVLSYLDSVTNGQFFNQTFLITGASGGMLGAAYYRELKYRLLTKKDTVFDNDKNFENLSKDILNPVIFSLFLKDWFFHFQKFKYKGISYYKDRASLFDQKFNCNTNDILNKPLGYYAKPEKDAQIPMIILSPTIVNYGRKLYISSQGVSYLVDYTDKFSNIDFRRFYTYFNPDSLSYIAALRMNATFPYISPIISMPGSPRLNIMDAAISDNYGLTTTLKFIYSFQDWIKENTSGVILLQITEDGTQTSSKSSITTLDEFIMPLTNIYANLFDNQELNNRTLINLTRQSIDKKIDFIYFNLDERNKPVSLSWHLSKNEKNIIKQSVKSRNFVEQYKKLNTLIQNQK